MDIDNLYKVMKLYLDKEDLKNVFKKYVSKPQNMDLNDDFVHNWSFILAIASVKRILFSYSVTQHARA